MTTKTTDSNPMWSLLIGEFRIAPGVSTPDKIAIWKDDGEGGEFDGAQFRKAIKEFFDENF